MKKAPPTGGVRFAPSPTGRFHIGNLRTAWVSYQLAQKFSLPWVVRFEDIDRPRVLPGAQEQQLADMLALGLKPSIVLLQSEFHERHWSLFVDALRSGQVYACDCSRKDVQAALAGLASAPHDGQAPVYSGHCRELAHAREMRAAETLAWRFRMPAATGADDFIVARTGPALSTGGLPASETFVPAYHWACAIDDYDGAYQVLVRSSDLASAAVLQRAIHDWVAKREGVTRLAPAVFHTSLMTEDDGHRLEKRTRGVTWPELQASGWDSERLLEIFARSFVLPSELSLAPAQVYGEVRLAIRLSDLN